MWCSVAYCHFFFDKATMSDKKGRLTGMVWLPWRALIADWASVCVENLTKAQPEKEEKKFMYTHTHTHIQYEHSEKEHWSEWRWNPNMAVELYLNLLKTLCSVWLSSHSRLLHFGHQTDWGAGRSFRLNIALMKQKKTCYLAPHACLCMLTTTQIPFLYIFFLRLGSNPFGNSVIFICPPREGFDHSRSYMFDFFLSKLKS